MKNIDNSLNFYDELYKNIEIYDCEKIDEQNDVNLDNFLKHVYDVKYNYCKLCT